jgi:hypothetical protein
MESLESIAKSNVSFALDSEGASEQAFYSFLQNAIDSALSAGYPGEEALECGELFSRYFREATGLSF